MQLTTKALFSQENIKQKFHELLGQKAQGFIASVLQICSNDRLLKDADPLSVFNAAAVAATLDLPINANLGFAYIIGYNVRQTDGSYKVMAQFQIGYKGFIQLAQRSGQFRTISAAPIYKGQILSSNPLTGYMFDFTQRESDEVIGYAAYFALLNGFEKTIYMSIDELKSHGKKYSKSFGKDNGIWHTNSEGMYIKTPLKLLLSKFGPMSIEMQRAIATDQAVINNDMGTDVTYIDNEPDVAIDKTVERGLLMLAECKTLDEIQKLQLEFPEIPMDEVNAKADELITKK